MKGRACLKRVWLYNYRRNLAEAPSAFQETIFEQGHEVGRLAHQLFSGGVLVAEDYTQPDAALATTARHIANGTSTIFEAAFFYDNILIRTDVVTRNEDGSWDLFEVKSTTSVKKEHLKDAAIQRYVLSGAGLRIRSVHLIHLNREYIRQGIVDVNQLFRRSLLDAEIVDGYAEIPAYLAAIRTALANDEEPSSTIGSVCKSPYPCEFKSHCWSSVEPDSIHFLSRIKDTKRAELLGHDIEKIKNVPEHIELSELQLVQVRVEHNNAPNIERSKIKKHLSELRYPLWFLDFETYGFAIPDYEGTRSYEQLPFQFSLHIQNLPGAPLKHVEFLHIEKSDPRRALGEALVHAMGDVGSVITYHASFERGRIEELAEAFPDLKPKLDAIVDRLWDLETPFAKKWYYDRRFEGSSSIKKVLPVLVPSMSYEDMAIGKGDVAQVRYTEMIALPMDSPERENIRRNLLAYCGQDTLAMVKILAVLTTLQ